MTEERRRIAEVPLRGSRRQAEEKLEAIDGKREYRILFKHTLTTDYVNYAS